MGSGNREIHGSDSRRAAAGGEESNLQFLSSSVYMCLRRLHSASVTRRGLHFFCLHSPQIISKKVCIFLYLFGPSPYSN